MALLGICGALRAGSFNQKLLKEAGRLYGSEVELGNLRLPLYDGDLEANEGIPAEVQTLADQIDRAEAVLIATPEYNQGISGVLKNALDWVSRVEGNPWKGKPVALMSAAAGRTGGARAQFNLRLSMVQFRANIIPGPEVLVASASQHFHEDGTLMSDRYIKALQELMDQLKEAAAK